VAVVAWRQLGSGPAARLHFSLRVVLGGWGAWISRGVAALTV
jgi:hypothetical protein